MPWSAAQRRFFQGVKHGMKPRKGGGSSNLSPSKAASLLSHEDRKVKARIKGQKRALES